MTSWMQTCSRHTCGYPCTSKRPLQPAVVLPSRQLNRQCCSWCTQSRHSHSKVEAALVRSEPVKTNNQKL